MSITTAPSVRVIIPNWNGKHLIGGALKSLRQQSFKDFEIVVVDNGSIDGSTAHISKFFPDVKIISLAKNIGFAGGVNAGIKDSATSYVALLNNDAKADPRWLQELYEHMQANEKVAVAASKMLTGNKFKHIDSMGEEYSIWGLPYPKQRGLIDPGVSTAHEIFAASGGASMYRMSALNEVGLFDEDFFAYYEDVDLSFRIRLRGWKIILVPSAVVYHQVGATSSQIKGFGRRQIMRNSSMLYIKNMPLNLVVRTFPLFIVGQLALTTSALKNGQLGAIISSWWFLINQAPRLFIKRAQILKRRTVSDREVYSWLSKEWPLVRGKR